MRNPAMKRVRELAEALCSPSNRSRGDSWAGAVDANGFTGP